MKIGLFGGSFNPIHNGHINLATSVKDSLGLDKVILIPSKKSPHKDSSAYVSNTHRLNMCRLAIQGLKGFEVSDFEINRDTISYSIYTVEYFNSKYPNDILYLLIGSDMLLTFDTWKEYKRILSMVKLVVVSRQNGDMQSLLLKAQSLRPYGDAIILNTPPLEISSTEVRKKVAFNEECSCILDEKVVQYIKSNGLYL